MPNVSIPNWFGELPLLNEYIHADTKHGEYHMMHVDYVNQYACIINQRMGFGLDENYLLCIAQAHDLLKERSLDPKVKGQIALFDHVIPQDTRRYVRMNIDVLDEYGIGEYFNSSVQYHSLASGIFVHKEFDDHQPEILYPIFFHSCPVISVYETLDPLVQTYVDVIMLSDKLSSNYLKINLKESPVRIDLEQAVFGESGNEMNYTLGLALSRIVTHGKQQEKQGALATEFYYNRFKSMCPLASLPTHPDKLIGGPKKWPKRKSPLLKMHSYYSRESLEELE